MKSFFLAALLIGTAAVTIPTSAQTLRLNLETLDAAADQVIIGRAVSLESTWAEDRSAILTRVMIEVRDPDTGAALGQEFVTVPGGRVGEYIHEVSDMPHFIEGQEVAVFLTRHESGHNIVTGGWQGKLEVVEDPATGQKQVLGATYLLDDEVTGFARQDESAEAAMSRASLPLSEFVSKVRKLKREK